MISVIWCMGYDMDYDMSDMGYLGHDMGFAMGYDMGHDMGYDMGYHMDDMGYWVYDMCDMGYMSYDMGHDMDNKGYALGFDMG